MKREIDLLLGAFRSKEIVLFQQDETIGHYENDRTWQTTMRQTNLHITVSAL